MVPKIYLSPDGHYFAYGFNPTLMKEDTGLENNEVIEKKINMLVFEIVKDD